MLVPDLATAAWRKSSRSAGGANNCIEIAAGATWRKSTRSAGADNCVEVAAGTEGRAWAAVRDSKDPDGPVLVVSPAAFTAFVHHVTIGRLR